MLIALIVTTASFAHGGDLADTLAVADRSEADAERDRRAKPAEILEFFGIEAGMHVADLFTGGGYYSEVLSIAVGPEGQVIAHNNEAYASFAGDAPANRFRGRGLDNLNYMVTETSDLQLPQDLDAIIMVMSITLKYKEYIFF